MDALETRLENAKLASAIDNACKSLPGDCIVHLAMSQDAVIVTLEVDGNEWEFSSNRESLSDTINDAVECAQSLNG